MPLSDLNLEQNKSINLDKDHKNRKKDVLKGKGNILPEKVSTNSKIPK
mgnify:CR=1 FL=1|jgi:hypothetical protein